MTMEASAAARPSSRAAAAPLVDVKDLTVAFRNGRASPVPWNAGSM